MASAAETVYATLTLLAVTASFPFYLYGAWVILREDVVTWSVLRRHLAIIFVGLTLTTIPVITWMAPRLLTQIDGFAALHAFLGLQAYALLVFALTGIIHIFRAKYEHDLYREPDQEIAIDDLHENMDAWRFRLRVGVFGYVVFWLLAWIVGVVRFVFLYEVLDLVPSIG